MRLRDALAALALLASSAAADPSGSRDMVVRAGRLVDGSGHERADAQLVVRDGRIRGGAAPDGASILDASAFTVVPGFVDLRSPAGLPLAQNEEESEVTAAFRAIDLLDGDASSFEAALRGGVTTAVAAPGGRAVVGGLAGAVKTEAGLLETRVVEPEAALVVTLGLEPPLGNRIARFQTPYGLYFRRPGNRMGVASELRRALGSARTGSGEGARVMREALAGTLPVWMRARTEGDIRTALRIAAEHELRPVLLEATEAHRVLDALPGRVRAVVLGPSYAQPRNFLEAWEGTDLRLTTAALLDAKGIDVAFASGPRDRPDALREWAALAVRAGLPRARAIASITSVPARLLGAEGRLGDLSPGCDADFAIVDGDPLDVAAPVVAVVVGGRLAWHDPVRGASLLSSKGTAP